MSTANPHDPSPDQAVPLPKYVPPTAYVLPLRVRSYEVTEAGAIGIGATLRYLEHLATSASAARGFDHLWYERSGVAWVVREMDLLLGARPGIDDELLMATWLSEFRRVQAHREYAIWRPSDRRLVARARGRWAYVDRVKGQLTRLPDELVARFGVAGYPMRPRGGAIDAEHGAPLSGAGRDAGRMELTARGYECDTQRHVNNTVYADWLAEALERSLGLRLGGTDAPLPRYVRLEYMRPVRAGERVAVTTRVVRRGSRELVSAQTISDPEQGTVYLRAAITLLCRPERDHD